MNGERPPPDLAKQRCDALSSNGWTRRRMLRAGVGVAAMLHVGSDGALAGPSDEGARPQPLDKLFDTLPILGVSDLEWGDVLHLRVNSVFTSYHSVRPVINAIQVRMLTSASRSPKSIYHDVFHEYRKRRILADDPVPGLDSDADAIRDLTDTGHTTIYVGDGQVIETTGEGCRLRNWSDVDTARYVVMRAHDAERRALIHAFARAFGGSVLASEVQEMLGPLGDRLPATDADYLGGLCDRASAWYIADKYDTFSGSRGFFRKLETRYHIGSPTPIDTMLYHDRRQPPRLHRDTICSSSAALVVALTERAIGWKAIGRTLRESGMTAEQRQAFAELRAGAGCSIHVRPEHVLPAYLELGMKLSGQYQTVGQFINLGSATNTGAPPGSRLDLVRPHAAFMAATAAFVDRLAADERARISMPSVAIREGFNVIGHGKLPHTADLAAALAIYRGISARR